MPPTTMKCIDWGAQRIGTEYKLAANNKDNYLSTQCFHLLIRYVKYDQTKETIYFSPLRILIRLTHDDCSQILSCLSTTRD